MPSAPLTDAEKTDSRRHAGYGAYGPGPGDGTFNRFSVAYVTLEYRIANLSDPELAVVRTYLAALNTLEAAILGAGANLDTARAAVWYHNEDEVGDRSGLFDNWRKRFCAFLGIPPGDGLGDSSVRFVI